MVAASDQEITVVMIAEKQAAQEREYERQKVRAWDGGSVERGVFKMLAEERNQVAREKQKRDRGMEGATDEDLAWRLKQESIAAEEVKKIKIIEVFGDYLSANPFSGMLVVYHLELRQ